MTGQKKPTKSRKKVIKEKSIDEIERICFQVCTDNPNMYVPWYIMAAYAYYIEDTPILSDTTFDKMSLKILKEWDNIEHFHKQFLTKEMLVGGTYLGEYPTRVEGAVKEIRKT